MNLLIDNCCRHTNKKLLTREVEGNMNSGRLSTSRCFQALRWDRMTHWIQRRPGSFSESDFVSPSVAELGIKMEKRGEKLDRRKRELSEMELE